MTLPYVRERKQFDSPIGTFGLMQGKIADMYTSLQSSRAFAYQVRAHLSHGAQIRVHAAACLLHASGCGREGHPRSDPVPRRQRLHQRISHRPAAARRQAVAIGAGPTRFLADADPAGIVRRAPRGQRPSGRALLNCSKRRDTSSGRAPALGWFPQYLCSASRYCLHRRRQAHGTRQCSIHGRAHAGHSVLPRSAARSPTPASRPTRSTN